MAYIGRSVDIGMFEKQVLTPNSSTTTFTLNFAVGAANSLLVVYGGVIQEPNVAYSVSGGGQQIVFSEAPVTGTTLYIIYLGKQLSTPRTVGQETTKQSFTGDGTTSVFSLSDAPVVPAGIMVFVDGILQREGSGANYISSGSTITFTAAPDSGAEIDVYTLVKEKVSIDTVADGSITAAKLDAGIRKTVGTYYETSANITAVAGRYYFVDTSAGAVTVTLPASATLGDTVRLIDAANTFDTNNLTVARNGHKIMGDTSDMTVSTEGASFDLVYHNATNGWKLFSVEGEQMASYSSKKYPTSSISTAQLADGTVAAVDLANGSVTTDKINDLSVTAAKMANGAALANIGDGTITNTKLASGAAVANIGYTPTRRYETGALLVTATGSPWVRVAHLQGRWSYRVTAHTTGGWYGPGLVQFTIHRGWGNDIYVAGVDKLNSVYCTAVRANSPTQDQDWYLELYFSGIHSSSGNGTSLWDAWSNVTIEPLGPQSTINAVYTGTVLTNPASAGYISGPITL